MCKSSILAIVFALLVSCKDDAVVVVDYSSEDFEELWSTTDMHYPFFGFKKLNWDSVYAVYQPQFVNSTEDIKIKLLGDLLNELKDGHANLFDKNSNPLSFYRPIRSLKDANSFSFQVIEQYFTSKLKVTAEIFTYEVLPGNIGYIYISSFPQNESDYKEFDAVLAFLKETDGLVIDIRQNGGGSTNASDYFISRLISKELNGTLWTNRGGGYRQLKVYTPAGDFQYTKPTVLLINGKSFSTSEAMANLCKKIKHISLIGDTTAGGGGVPDEMFRLPSGLKFRVPTRCAMRYDGNHIEWNGIPPDIVVSQTEADIINKKDKQLEFAINYLN